MKDKSNFADTIRQLVQQRGYCGDELSLLEHATKQLAKFLEELAEVCVGANLPYAITAILSRADHYCGRLFDMVDVWKGCSLDVKVAKRELVDVGVVLFTFASIVYELAGDDGDFLQDVYDKAAEDVKRGIRGHASERQDR